MSPVRCFFDEINSGQNIINDVGRSRRLFVLFKLVFLKSKMFNRAQHLLNYRLYLTCSLQRFKALIISGYYLFVKDQEIKVIKALIISELIVVLSFVYSLYLIVYKPSDNQICFNFCIGKKFIF